jgi:hypothetical protein
LTTGLLPSQLLRGAVAQGREILSPQPIGDDQIQPASIDLRLGEVAYRVRASFLSGARASVRDKLKLPSIHRIDLTEGAVLERDCTHHIHRGTASDDAGWVNLRRGSPGAPTFPRSGPERVETSPVC